MIICRKRNFVFLRVTKTASTSITHHLLDHIPRNEIDYVARNDYIANMDEKHRTDSQVSGHATLGDLIRAKIITHEETKTLRVFAVVRDPVERFLSAAHHYHVGQTHNVDFSHVVNIKSNISNEEAVKVYLPSSASAWEVENPPEKIAVGPPQWHWLEFNGELINGILAYPHFEDFFREIGVPTQIKHKHRSEFRFDETRSELSQESRDRILSVYRKDWEIWKSVSC